MRGNIEREESLHLVFREVTRRCGALIRRHRRYSPTSAPVIGNCTGRPVREEW